MSNPLALKLSCQILRGFFILPIRPMDKHSFKEILNEDLRNKIYGIIYRLAGNPRNVEHNWGEIHVFDSLPRLQIAIHEVAAEIFDGLNTLQKDFVAGWIYHHAGRPQTTDTHWGEHHAKDNAEVLLHSLVEYLERDPAVQKMQRVLEEWLTLDQGPDEDRGTAAQRILQFITDPRFSLSGAVQEIDLSGLHLTNIDPLCCLRQIGVSVQILNLSHNRLSQLPRMFGHYFPNLERLDVSHNMLETLPETIFEMETLRYVRIAHNRINAEERLRLGCLGLGSRWYFDGLSEQDSIRFDGEPAHSAPVAALRRPDARAPAPQPFEIDRTLEPQEEDLVFGADGRLVPFEQILRILAPEHEDMRTLAPEHEYLSDGLPRTVIPAPSRAPQPSTPERPRFVASQPNRENASIESPFVFSREPRFWDAVPTIKLDVPGTIPYVQGRIPSDVQSKASEIKRLEKEFDKLAVQPAIPEHFVCGIMQVGFMSIPVFDASHKPLQEAIKGTNEEAKMNRSIRHTADQESMEGNIRANPHSAVCHVCRHGIKRENLRIDIALQDEILAFLRNATKK